VNADELHDALLTHGFLTQAEGQKAGWEIFFDELASKGRATTLKIPGGGLFWVATERLPFFDALYPGAAHKPRVTVPEGFKKICSEEDALKEIVRGRLEALGPVTAAALAGEFLLPESGISRALLALENEGFVFRGSFTPGLGAQEWCERRLLQRIHKYTIESLRQSIQPVSLQNFARFLFDLHRVSGDEKPEGPEALYSVIETLEGFEAPASAWESDLLPARTAHYSPQWLDALCLSGRVVWGRFSPPKPGAEETKKSGPVKSTPVSLVPRARRDLWRGLKAEETREPALGSAAKQVLEHLKSNGASFFDDIASGTGLLKDQVKEGLAQLAATGLAVSDSFAGLRALVSPAKPRHRLRPGRRENWGGLEESSRWSLVKFPSVAPAEKAEYAGLEQAALVYLRRWGVLFRALVDREAFAPPWRVLVRVLRRMELRGELRGGRFVCEVSGEQFAYPETVERLRAVKKRPETGELVSLSAADPLNLLGVILPGKRVAKLSSNRVLYRDGVPVAALEGKEVRFLRTFESDEAWRLRRALIRGGTARMAALYDKLRT
jgi:ATP-dependent Lhr-like helicase